MKTFYSILTTAFVATLSGFFAESVHAQSMPLGNVYNAQWTNTVGVSVSGNTVTKTASAGWGNAGASSVNTLAANTDGYIEFQILTAGQTTVIGLSSTDLNANYTSVNFAFNTVSGNVLENGTTKYTGTAPAMWETFRIERIAGNIYYKRNGTIVYTSTQTSTSTLIADIALNVANQTVSNVTCSFGATSQQALAQQVNNAVWQSTVGASVTSGNTLTKTGSAGWNSGASTLNTLNPNTSGWIQFTLDNTTQQKAVGLSRTDADANYTSIDYALVVNGATVSVTLAGTSQYSFTAATGDVLRVERSGSSVLFKQNGNTLYTVSNAYSTTLIGDVSLYTASATLTSVQTSFWIPYTQGNAPDQYEFSALKTMYDSLAGSGWTTKTNWPAAGSWPSSATISQMATWFGVVTLGNDISQLNLQSNNLTGRLPAAFGLLTGLTQAQLYSNRLSGTIPSEIGSLKRLTTLSLQTNNIAGAIPSSASGLASLSSLNISANRFTGVIPSTLGNLSKLTYLNLSGNQLSGPFPLTLLSLTNLTSLYLSGLPINGSIPQGISNLNKLINLDLSSCSLTGTIPAELANITTLQRLYLNQNQLTGSIPSQFSNLTNLIYLYLHTNQLSGPLPSLTNLTNLQILYVSNNKLQGTIPSITNLTQLAYLYLDNNNFEGTLPADIGNSTTHLLMVKLMNNSLSGDFPASIGSCTSLSYLSASGNKFTSLPSGILSLPVITTLNFDNNNLKSIPDFSTHVNKANLTLTLTNNQLDFAQLEPQVNAGIHAVTYVPQKNITDVTSLTYIVNSALTIPARAAGQFSTITWQKQQSDGSWATVNSSNNDATQLTYKINSAQSTDQGTYKWSMTNTKVTGVTIQSDPIVVSNTAVVTLNQWAFQYKYDYRNRMAMKKVPGADWVYMVYDDRDRLVLTQDGNQRLSNQWLFTKYDALNRPVSTGIYSPGSTIVRDTMQNIVNNYYANLNSAQAWYECFTTSSGNVHFYDNKSFPQVTDPTQYLTVTYYDDNSALQSQWGANYQYVNDQLASGTYSQLTTDFRSVKGHPVASKIKLLDGSNTWLKAVTYYDDKYRTIQIIADNNKGGTDRVSNLYDFVGKVLTSKTTHKTSTHADQTVARNFTYDHGQRLMQTTHSVNGATPVVLVQNEYNEIGQLVTKTLGTQHVDYRYNIRGWLTSINNSQLTNDGGVTNSDNNDLFGMNLSYNDVVSGISNNAQYNGNISAIKWSSNLALGTTKDVAYNYSYDPMNRITAANYLTNPGVWTASNAFAENGFTYDLNGNIKTLTRTNATGATLDNLTYDYTGQGNAGNQLRGVSDAGDVLNGFADGNMTGDDYSYDVNGNMTADKNKNITAITYNHLNLPQQVTKGTGEYIKYTYDAGGRKLKQQVYNASNAVQKTTDYAGEFIYQGDTLQFVNHEEGRIVTKTATPEYQYHLKDHLGNVRMTFTTQRVTEQPVATFETANQNTEQSQFLRYDDARVINSALFDHTHNGTTAYSERLSGSANEKTGIARSISVMPGDTIRMEVFAKYVDASNSNNTSALTNLLAQIVAGTASAGTVIDGANYSTSGITPFPYTGLAGETNSTGVGPKAYLNYIMFDRNFVPIISDASQTNFVRMTTIAKEDGTNVAHERLYAQVVVKQPGYMYIYLSNEETNPVEVYFDDFKVTQVKSPVVQMEDFYPFGLSFNSYSRENTVPQNYLFGGKELQTDLGLNWGDFGARMYDASIARWMTVDPLTEKSRRWSPYTYCYNNPLRFIDLDGMFGDYYTKNGAYLGNDGKNDDKVYTATKATTTTTKGADGKSTTTTAFKDSKEIGKKSDFVDMNGKTISSETTKRNLVGLAINLRNVGGIDGAKIKVEGGDRNSSKNKAVGGSSTSPHIAGTAADISVSGMTNKSLADAAASSGLFTGVIYYPNAGETSGFGTHQETAVLTPYDDENPSSTQDPPTTQVTVTNYQNLPAHTHVDNRPGTGVTKLRYTGDTSPYKTQQTGTYGPLQ